MTHKDTSLLRETATLAPFAGCLVFLLVVAALGDARPGELLPAVGAVLLFHVVPGVLLWRAVRPVDGWLVEDLAMGFALGACVAVPTQVLTAWTGLGLLPYAVPLALSAGLLAVPATRRRIRSRRAAALAWWWGPGVAVALLLPVLAFVSARANVVRWHGFARRYVDMPFHEGLVGEALSRFPLHYPYLSQEEVAYHWFGHAWTANIVALSGSPIDVTMWRVTPALLHVAAPLLCGVVAMRISRSQLAGPVAAAVAYLGSSIQPWAQDQPHIPLTVLSPTQEFAMLLMPALLAVVVMRWRDELPRIGGFAVLLLVMVVAGGAKGTTIAVLIPGLVLATVAMLAFDRSRARMVALDAALAMVVLYVLTKTVFDGSGESLEVDPLVSLVRVNGRQLGVPDATVLSAAGITVLVIVTLKYSLVALGLFGALGTRAGRADPALWTLLGAAIAGFGALVVFSHPGLAEYYFFKTSLVPLGIGTACGLSLLVRAVPEARRTALLGAGAGSVAAVALWLAAGAVETSSLRWALLALGALLLVAAVAGGFSWRRAGAVAAALTAATAMIAAGGVSSALTATTYDIPDREVSATAESPTWVPYGAVEAFRWLRDHSDTDDLLATNQHCLGRTSPRCSRRAFSVSAYTERRVLVEGWAYVPRASALYDPDNGITSDRIPYWDPELLAANDAFFLDPSRSTRQALLDLGVRWLVVVKKAPHAKTLEPFATRRHATRHVDIYEFTGQ